MKIQKIKTLLFGGAFDPPHKSHLDTAIVAMDYHEFRNSPVELWFVMCNSNEFGHEELTSIEHREPMLEQLTSYISNSYTYVDKKSKDGIYASVIKLISKYPEREFYYVMGTDQARKIRGWRHSRDFLKTIPIIVVAKSYIPKAGLFDWCFNPPHIFINFPNVTHHEKDNSYRSSNIRMEYRKNHKQIDEFKPIGILYGVHRYIMKHGLYK
jgi:nicotinic acid mononucleotide adenylyltransferase